jgi:hypothetical protein
MKHSLRSERVSVPWTVGSDLFASEQVANGASKHPLCLSTNDIIPGTPFHPFLIYGVVE